jgi:hypothetical protein
MGIVMGMATDGYGYSDRRNGGWLGRVRAWLKRLGEG